MTHLHRPAVNLFKTHDLHRRAANLTRYMHDLHRQAENLTRHMHDVHRPAATLTRCMNDLHRQAANLTRHLCAAENGQLKEYVSNKIGLMIDKMDCIKMF
jgi:hypothetical protein